MGLTIGLLVCFVAVTFYSIFRISSLAEKALDQPKRDSARLNRLLGIEDADDPETIGAPSDGEFTPDGETQKYRMSPQEFQEFAEKQEREWLDKHANPSS